MRFKKIQTVMVLTAGILSLTAGTIYADSTNTESIVSSSDTIVMVEEENTGFRVEQKKKTDEAEKIKEEIEKLRVDPSAPETEGEAVESISSASTAEDESTENVVSSSTSEEDEETLKYEMRKLYPSGTEEKAKTLREQYNALPDAYKVLVTNLDVLEQAESVFDITQTDTGEDTQSAGFEFDVADGTASVKAEYAEPDAADAEGAGKKMFTFRSPSDARIQIPENTTYMENEGGKFYATWTDTYVQFDLTDVPNGTWSLSSDTIAKYSKSSEPVIHGTTAPKAEKEDTENVGTTSSSGMIQPEGKDKPALSGDLVRLIAMSVAMAGLIIALVSISILQKQKAKRRQENKTRASEQKAEKKTKEEEEKESLREYWERLKKQEAEQEKENAPVTYKEEKEGLPKEKPDIEEYDEYPSKILEERKRKTVEKADRTDNEEDQSGFGDDMF